MRHPFDFCTTRLESCCFCFDLGPRVTCYIIATLCIVVNGFSGVTNYGVGHWALYFISITNLLLHLSAGIFLLLGTIWGKISFKLVYCWLCFLGIFTVIAASLVCVFLYGDAYTIWMEISKLASFIIVLLNTIWLLFWDIYTPMVVLGNLADESDHYCSHA